MNLQHTTHEYRIERPSSVSTPNPTIKIKIPGVCQHWLRGDTQAQVEVFDDDQNGDVFVVVHDSHEEKLRFMINHRALDNDGDETMDLTLRGEFYFRATRREERESGFIPATRLMSMIWGFMQLGVIKQDNVATGKVA